MSYEDLTETPVRSKPEEDEVNAHLRLLTDDERLYWIANVPPALTNSFAKAYHRAELTNNIRLKAWLDTQLKLRAAENAQRTGHLLEGMKMVMLRIAGEDATFTPGADEVPKKGKKGLW